MPAKTVSADQTVEAVVNSFTQAELALAEVKSAIASFAAASEQLAASDAASAAATQALTLATSTSDQVAKQLEAVGARLGETVDALRAVDPDRLWGHLAATEEWHQASEARRADAQALLDQRTRQILRIAVVGAGAALGGFVLILLIGVGVIQI